MLHYQYYSQHAQCYLRLEYHYRNHHISLATQVVRGQNLRSLAFTTIASEQFLPLDMCYYYNCNA